MSVFVKLGGKNIGELEDSEWKIMAACRNSDPALFFSTLERDESKAKSMCFTCPVREQCLDAGLLNNERGIWGGYNERERVRIKRRRRAEGIRNRRNN